MSFPHVCSSCSDSCDLKLLLISLKELPTCNVKIKSVFEFCFSAMFAASAFSFSGIAKFAAMACCVLCAKYQARVAFDSLAKECAPWNLVSKKLPTAIAAMNVEYYSLALAKAWLKIDQAVCLCTDAETIVLGASWASADVADMRDVADVSDVADN